MADLKLQTSSHRYQRYFTDLGQFYQNKKTRTYGGIILSLVKIIFFVFFAIRPTLKTITQLIRQTKDQKKVAEEMEKKINSLAEAQRNYLAIESDLPVIEEAIPQKAEIALLTKEIEALAKEAGVDLKSLRFNEIALSADQQPKEKQEIKISFNVLGSYSNLKNFLRNLMSLRRVILVENFSFQTGKEDSSILSLTFSAEAWFLNNPK
jgi:Tfp pilus assembly protein PilO